MVEQSRRNMYNPSCYEGRPSVGRREVQGRGFWAVFGILSRICLVNGLHIRNEVR